MQISGTVAPRTHLLDSPTTPVPIPDMIPSTYAIALFQPMDLLVFAFSGSYSLSGRDRISSRLDEPVPES